MLRNWLGKSSPGWSINAKRIAYGWITDGLKPRCITRDLKWGIPVPIEKYKEKVCFFRLLTFLVFDFFFKRFFTSGLTHHLATFPCPRITLRSGKNGGFLVKQLLFIITSLWPKTTYRSTLLCSRLCY